MARLAVNINGPTTRRMDVDAVGPSLFEDTEIQWGDIGRNDKPGVVRADVRLIGGLHVLINGLGRAGRHPQYQYEKTTT